MSLDLFDLRQNTHGDILRVSLNEAILSAAAGVLAAANDTGGVGGTRPSF